MKANAIEINYSGGNDNFAKFTESGFRTIKLPSTGWHVGLSCKVLSKQKHCEAIEIFREELMESITR